MLPVDDDLDDDALLHLAAYHDGLLADRAGPTDSSDANLGELQVCLRRLEVRRRRLEADTPAGDRNPDPEASAALEAIVEQFEDAWEQGRPLPPDHFLPLEEPLRTRILVELVHADLERRLKAGEAARVEAYLQRYPELAATRDVVVDLIRREIGLRRRREHELTMKEYAARFPAHFDDLQKNLSTLSEAAASSTASYREGRPSAPTGQGLPSIPGYEVLDELGRGGMGVVYKARQAKLKRLVALKMILSSRADAAELARFRAEAVKLARLQHPNIVQIHEVGEHEAAPYFSMEFVPGGSLARYLAGTPVPAGEAAMLVETLAHAMHHAHQRGIVHRDLKPANVFLASVGDAIPEAASASRISLTHYVAKVGDFGLAKGLNLELSQQTSVGAVAGTPSYMAPEQAMGQTREAGPPADVYALGAILYEALTGRPPFKGATPADTMLQVIADDPVPPAQLNTKVPRDLELICLKCLDKEPLRRYASAAQLAEELRRYRDGLPLAFTRPVGRLERGWRWCRRNPALASSGGAAALLLATVVVVLLVFGIRSARDARDLRDAQGDTEEALGRAQRNAEKADEERHRAERQSVDLVLDRGLALCEQGDLGAGLLWLARSLEIAERSEATDDLRRAIRINLRTWGRELLPVRQVLDHKAGHVALVLREGNGGTRGNPNPGTFGHRALRFSPDGRALVTCQDRTARLWDTATGQHLGPPLKHDDTINAAVFSPDGKTLLIGSRNGQARFWDPRTGELRRSPLGPSGSQDRDTQVGWSPDGKVAATSFAHIVYRWDAATLTALRPHLTGDATVLDLAFSPDSKLLLVGTEKSARLWDAATGTPVGQKMTGMQTDGTRPDQMHLVSFAPDGKTCAVGWWPGRLMEVPSGKPIAELKHDVSPSYARAYSPDSKLLLTTCVKSIARIWDTRDGRLLRDLPNQKGLVTAAFSPDGPTCIYGGMEGKLRLCDPATGKLLGPPLQHEGTLLHAAYSSDGQTLLTWTDRGVVQLRDTVPRRLLPQAIPIPAGSQWEAPSPDGRTFVTLSPEGKTAQVRDAITGMPVGKPLEHQQAIRMVAYRPDSKAVLTGSLDGTARVWDAATRGPLGPPLRLGDPVDAVYWNSDGTKVLTVTRAGAQRWEAGSGRSLGAPVSSELSKLVVERPSTVLGMNGNNGYRANVFVFSRDGRIVQATSEGSTARLKELTDGRELAGLGRHTAQVDGLALSPDGRVLVTGSADGKARLWDTATGQQLGKPLHHQEQVWTVCISPDQRRVLTGDRSPTVRLWNATTFAPLGPIIKDARLPAFSRDGRIFVTASTKGFRLWDAATGKALGPEYTDPAFPDTAEIRRLEISSDGAVVWTLTTDEKPSSDKKVENHNRRWDVGPLPLTGAPERITCWIEVITGLQLDEGGVARGLSVEEWQAKRARLQELGGPLLTIAPNK
jgi:eukaryotic-like serine/threonine-protein kinase